MTLNSEPPPLTLSLSLRYCVGARTELLLSSWKLLKDARAELSEAFQPPRVVSCQIKFFSCVVAQQLVRVCARAGGGGR